MNSGLAVELDHISKSFGPVIALHDVSLHVERGQMHALVGENGAGKTTLMKVLYGVHSAEEGTIKVDGAIRKFSSSAEAISAGVGMVSQHYGIIPELSCLQNLILGAEGGAFIDLAAAEQRADELAKGMGFEFNWHADAEVLSPAGAQKLEILKLLWRNAEILILDEPTAMLSPSDGDALFASLKKLTEAGKTVILVTHRLPEVFEHCKNVTVLRAGHKVAECAVSETNPSQLAEWIVGKALEKTEANPVDVGPVQLEIRDLTVLDDRGHEALKSASFRISEGELVGIAGVDGSGQRELFQALVGLRRIRSGVIEFGGSSIIGETVSARISKGIRLIPEDRHDEGVVEDWPLFENAALGLQRMPPFARGGWVENAGRISAAVEIANRFVTKYGAIGDDMASLSGGNQQRFVAARALYRNPKLILAFQPARGLDLAATQDVYQAIRLECRNGASALVVSYDLDELLENCDRVLVMNRGELTVPAAGSDRDREVIGRLMVAAQ